MQLLCRAVLAAPAVSAAHFRPLGGCTAHPGVPKMVQHPRSPGKDPAGVSHRKAEEEDFYQTEKQRSQGCFYDWLQTLM